MSGIGYQLTTAAEADSAKHAVPLFILPSAAAIRARPLQHLEFSALWFPVLLEGEPPKPALVRIAVDQDSYAFGGVSDGALATLVHDSLTFAEKQVGRHRRVYQMAFITSLSLQILLLVLRPPKGRTLFLTLQSGTWSTCADFRLQTGLTGFLAGVHGRRFPPPDRPA
ncbi:MULTISPECIES: hypothetical protein [Paraburkholderia]|uniref:Uncharacterized protein n=1 Tax=Paraburkholderia madseniana TaxID=2599607 RepID=A0AAP5BE20_9BURK|nr:MULTISPECIES: hypothetical protein [Paraburkholderia]MCX4146922.1 hypothetical protein [Paraburkholderia madseniana]MDN7149867.1 hypothetical protein [Paraburkholderia sp. WS6]MDQ6408747.1 hypothetical protein [Paraburkholderia madseniana]